MVLKQSIVSRKGNKNMRPYLLAVVLLLSSLALAKKNVVKSTSKTKVTKGKSSPKVEVAASSSRLALKLAANCPAQQPKCLDAEVAPERTYKIVWQNTAGKESKIDCKSGSTEYHPPLECHWYILPNNSFFVVDCWGHDSVLQNCEIRYFKPDGTQVENFKPALLSDGTKKPVMAIDITNITDVKINEKGQLVVEGEFTGVSKEIDDGAKPARITLESSGVIVKNEILN